LKQIKSILDKIKIVIYRVEKVLSTAVVAYVDAESKEEAIRKAENDEVVRDYYAIAKS
jgi:hypothetical protein